jgi:hypothetical protein
MKYMDIYLYISSWLSKVARGSSSQLSFAWLKLKILQLHRQAHVASDFQFSLKEGL